MRLSRLLFPGSREPPPADTAVADDREILARAEQYLDFILNGAYGDIPDTEPDHPVLRKIREVALACQAAQRHIAVRTAAVSRIEEQAAEALGHLQVLAASLGARK